MDSLRPVEHIKESPLMLDNDTNKVSNFDNREMISNYFLEVEFDLTSSIFDLENNTE